MFYIYTTFMIFNKLNAREKHTFSIGLIAYFFNGLTLGILILQEVILKKTLSGTPLQITILTMIMPISNLFSIYFARLIKFSKNKSTLFLLMGVFGKLSLILVSLINTPIPFIFILLLYYLFNSMMNPLMNLIFQVNFRKELRGILFGYMNALSIFISLIISMLAGKLLDINDNYYKILFVFAGILGFITNIFFSRIKISKKKMQNNSLIKNKKFDIMYPFKNMIYIFKNDKKYLNFEIAFFIYGMGFIVILPALPIYFVDIMKMDYSQISMAKGVLGQTFMILILPFAGKVHDKSNPVIYSAFTFALLSLYPLLLALAPNVYIISPLITVYFSFLIYSLAMSAVIIVWNLGSIYFAGDRHSSDYQSIHVQWGRWLQKLQKS